MRSETVRRTCLGGDTHVTAHAVTGDGGCHEPVGFEKRHCLVIDRETRVIDDDNLMIRRQLLRLLLIERLACEC